MLDTLVLTTTGSVEGGTLRAQWEPPITHHHSHNGDKSYNTYRYRLGGDYSPLLTYTAESRKLKVSIPSLPRYALGTSSILLDDSSVPAALDKVQRYVVEAGIRDLPAIADWEISKVDLAHDFQVGPEVANYMQAFGQIDIPGYTRVTYGNETVAWRSHSRHREIRFYDRHAKCIAIGDDPASTAMSQGVIRLEVQTSKADYRQTKGRTDIGSIFRSDVVIPMLQNYLGRLDLDNLRIITLRDIRTAATRRYGSKKASRIVNLLQDQTHGVKSDLHRSTIWRYKRDLAELGIAPVIGIRRLPPLEIAALPDTMVRMEEAEIDGK